MRKLFLLIPLLALTVIAGFSQGQKAKETAKESVVYFCSDITPENILKLYEAMGLDMSAYKNVGLKIHFGEDGNKNFLSPELVRPLVEKTNATLVETNVLYVGKRRYTQSHLALAKEHGFTFAPIDILDDEGETVYPVQKNFKFCKNVRTGSHFEKYDFYIVYSHFKGHGSSGFGGAIKNVGMGMASPGGKMAIHANNYPKAASARPTPSPSPKTVRSSTQPNVSAAPSASPNAPSSSSLPTILATTRCASSTSLWNTPKCLPTSARWSSST